MLVMPVDLYQSKQEQHHVILTKVLHSHGPLAADEPQTKPQISFTAASHCRGYVLWDLFLGCTGF